MAFCPNCGSQVTGRFCPNCGTDVGTTAGPTGTGFPQSSTAPLNAPGLTNPVACALCYFLWLITGIIFLILSPYNRDRTVRFHAFQSIFISLGIIMVDIVLGIFTGVLATLHMWWLGSTLWMIFRLGVFVLWVYMMYSAYNNRKVALPVVGPLAEKQA